jgi:hypothetical protein
MFEAFRTGIGRAGEGGFITVNEVRAFLNMHPADGGDELKKDAADAQPAPDNAGSQPAEPADQQRQ